MSTDPVSLILLMKKAPVPLLVSWLNQLSATSYPLGQDVTIRQSFVDVPDMGPVHLSCLCAACCRRLPFRTEFTIYGRSASRQDVEQILLFALASQHLTENFADSARQYANTGRSIA